jgi:hypothetical protein
MDAYAIQELAKMLYLLSPLTILEALEHLCAKVASGLANEPRTQAKSAAFAAVAAEIQASLLRLKEQGLSNTSFDKK